MLAKRILITNEAEILRPMENSLFRRQGFSLLIASDGRQAFEIIEDHDPALVILDLEMMTECGDACCKRVKTDPILRKTPIILVTRADRPEDMRRCREAGCNEVVAKPIDDQELLAVACRLLNITERRKPRIAMSLPAVVGRYGRHSRPGTVLNVNAGGAFVETRKLAPVDTEVILQFSLGEDGPDLRLLCRVAWVNHPEWVKALRLPVGMGLQFLEPDAKTVDAIENFIESRTAVAAVASELPPLLPGAGECGGE